MTTVPEQMVVADAEMLTLTGKFGFTVMVTEFDVEGLPVAQVELEVIIQVTTSLFARVALV